MRALAQRAADAAKDIKGLIITSNNEVRAGVKLVADSAQILNEILQGVPQVDSLICEIAASATEQANALGEVNTAINQLDKATQENAAMSEQTTAATGTLARESARLEGLVADFQLGGARSVAPRRRAA